MAKLMLSIREQNFQLLGQEARTRGITIQELLRAVVVPDWIRTTEIQGVERSGTIEHGPASTGQRENEIRSILRGQWSRKKPD